MQKSHDFYRIGKLKEDRDRQILRFNFIIFGGKYLLPTKQEKGFSTAKNSSIDSIIVIRQTE